MGHRSSDPIVLGAWEACMFSVKQCDAKIMSMREIPPGDVYSLTSSLLLLHVSTMLSDASQAESSTDPADEMSGSPIVSSWGSSTQLKSPPILCP